MKVILTVLIAAFVILNGCTYPQKQQSVSPSGAERTDFSRKGKVEVPDPRWVQGENREWWDVFQVEFEGGRKVRKQVGYLYRKYSQKNPKGYYWVKDLAQTDVGFLNPDLTAYRIIYSRIGGDPEIQKLETNTLNSGVKAILRIRGTMELKKVIPSPPVTPSTPGN